MTTQIFLGKKVTKKILNLFGFKPGNGYVTNYMIYMVIDLKIHELIYK